MPAHKSLIGGVKLKLLVKPIFILGLIIFLLGLTINLSYPQTKEIVVDPEEVVGKYVTGDPEEYLDIKKDGIFYLKEKGKYYSIVGAPETTGKWEIEKDKIIFFHPLGIVTRGKIEPNVIIDEEGKIWFKEGSIPQSIIIANAQEVPVANSFRFPLDGDWSPLWQDFNKWNSTWNGYHLGEDVGREDADKKNYAVYPMADGIVKFANIVLGYTVIIEHKLSDDDPDGNYVCSVYYHMKRPGEGGIKLNFGEAVSMDSPIGYVSGKWEDHKSSPHLHFGIRKGRYIPETDKDPRTGFWYYPGYTVIKKDGEVQKNPNDPIHKQILADWFNPSTDPKNGTGFIERHIAKIEQTIEISKATPIINSSLKINPAPPYYVGDTINAEFTITNKDSIPITFSVLTVGGRDPDNQVADFTHRQNLTLETSKSYNYQGTLTLNKVGDYHFFCTYQTPDGDWNTNIDLGPDLADEDRTEDISVEEKEKPSIAPDISEELYMEWDRSFEITNYQAQVKILENGDIQVSEIFEYDFEGDFNGIIRTIGIKGSDGFKYFKASEYFPEDKELEYTQSISADMVTYKIYDKSSNERKLFLLEYQLKNVATLYNDTAEFYWKFFDKSNTSPIGHIKIEIELPYAEVSVEEIKVFGHGPLDGKVSIREDGKIVYEVFGLSSGEMVEARILFPTSMIPNSTKIINQNKFAEIMEEESESIEALEEEVTAMEAVEDKIEEEITFKTFNYKDDYAEYSVKYPDWPNIPEAKFTHAGLKKSLDVGYSKEVSVHIIISQDFDLMDLYKFLREIPEDLEKEVMKRDTIEFYLGTTKIIKDEKTDNGNFMEVLLDLDGEFFKKDKEDIDAFLNSSKIHVLFKDFYCKENNKYFSVSITVVEDKWSKYQNIAKSIINSMKVIKTEKEKLIIDSSLYHIECSKPIVSGDIFVVLSVNVSGPADELALLLTNPKGETDIRFISKRGLIDNFETVKLVMGDVPYLKVLIF